MNIQAYGTWTVTIEGDCEGRSTRQHGWKVNYDMPCHNESYDGYYIFVEKKDN